MKPPKTYEALLAFILLILGGVFTLLGLAAAALSLPMRSGAPRDFALWGLPLLLFGAGLLWYARQAIRHPWSISFGSDGLHKRSPWTVLCIYQWEGRTYSIRSQFLWRRPREGELHPTVYLDPLNPRWAWIDPDTLQFVLE